MLPAERPIIFISYRRADSGWAADAVAMRLRRAFGDDRVFMDIRGIEPGEDFTVEIEAALARASVLIALIGRDWLRAQDEYGRRRLDRDGDWVRREIRAVLGKHGCTVIPLLVDDANLPNDPGALPDDLAGFITLQRARLRQAESGSDLERLCGAIVSDAFPRLDLREFEDEDVNEVVARLRRLRQADGSVSRDDLIPELDQLFNRKTFRYETLRGCPEQRWPDRLHSAYQTLRVLREYMPNVRKVAPDKYAIYNQMVMEVEKYAMQMGTLLFEEHVDYNAIELHIGKPTFKDHLPPKHEFDKGPERQPIISDSINDLIDPHRARAVELMDQFAAPV